MPAFPVSASENGPHRAAKNLILSELAAPWATRHTGAAVAGRPKKLTSGRLAALLAWLVFNGHTVSTLGNNFSQVVFQFRVSPALLWTGLKWALGIGLVGGLFPALRAARLPVTEALRAA